MTGFTDQEAVATHFDSNLFLTANPTAPGRTGVCKSARMRTPDGHTAVEAAHIVPWSESHDDLPTNGLCLCRLCHWSFDEGLMSVGKTYEVLVSDRVRIDSNMPGHVLTLMDRPIFKPEKKRYWPDQANLDRHRKTYFA